MPKYREVNLGVNGRASELQTIIEHDGPISVILQNEGEGEYALAMKRGDNSLNSAPSPELQVNDQAQVLAVPPSGSATDFDGVLLGNSPNPHPILITALDGATSVAATRTLTSATGGFVAAGIKVGDVLVVNESGGSDNGQYRVVEVTSDTVLTIDRDWPTGGAATQDFWVYGRTVVAPGSVQITLTIGTATVLVTDDGNGILYGVIDPVGPPITEVHGTINYFTGYWSIVCDTAPDNTTDVEITFAESLPVVAGGKISFPIVNARHGEPISFYGIGNGADVPCLVQAFVG